LPEKTDLSKSLSHMQYPNHTNANLTELFEPTFVKLDKQVSFESKNIIRFTSYTIILIPIFIGFEILWIL
jgi:hypothetical protein